jgi:hypothetical protein
MATIKRWTLCKILAVMICLVIAGEAHYALAFQNPAGTAAQADPQEAKFHAAKEAYAAGKYEEARDLLQKLAADLEVIEGRETLKGATYLLLGADYEKLGSRDLSVKFYCRAKAILGVGKTIEGLDLKKLKYYGDSCTGSSGSVAGIERSGSGGSFFGSVFKFVLLTALLSGAIYALFFAPWAPFKKKSKSDSSSDSSSFTSACFRTDWRVDIQSEWQGNSGTITFTPDGVAPNPNQNNGWDDSVTYTLSTSGGTLTSITLKLSVTVSGGDNGKRHDLIYIDGGLILDQTNTFTQSCSAPGSTDYANVYVRNSTGSFTLRHKVELSKAANLGAAVKVNKK